MKNFFFFLIFSKINLSIERDVCILSNKASKSDFKCEKCFCGVNFSFKCGVSHCSTNVAKCFEFIKAKHLAGFAMKSGDWNATEICLNGKGCYKQKVVLMRSRTNHKILKKIDCPCINAFRVLCNEDKYCALIRDHCKSFNMKMRYFGSEFNAVKCFNDDIIINLNRG